MEKQGLSIPVGTFAVADPPNDWSTYPPVHVKPNATARPIDYSPGRIRFPYGFNGLNGDVVNDIF
jgi:hypothetical protein